MDSFDFRIVQVDLARDALELRWRTPDGSAFGSIDRLREWGERQHRPLLFAMNAGIYDRQSRPLGLFIENSQTLRRLNAAISPSGSGNFAIQPNGIFYIDPHDQAGVMPTEEWRKHPIDAKFATQSGPMLVIQDAINANFDAHSDSLKWRSGVCAKSPDHVVFAVSEAPVSFHVFARLFRDEIGCRDALYLDGTLSRLYTDRDGYFGAPAMMVKPYAGMFAVFGDAGRTQ